MTKPSRDVIICDLTQSYAPVGGGGIGTYLSEKRRYILDNTEHTLLQIVPGAEDRITEQGRHIWVEVGAGQVPGSPNYRFILRTAAVREVLERFRPDIIESLCPWVLPWTAINYRRAFPQTALVAGYHTDFPNAHVHRVGKELFGPRIAKALRSVSKGYAGMTYREFDHVYVLGEDMRPIIREYGIDRVDVVSLGVDTDTFNPARRDPGFRRRTGLSESGPLLIYAGRIDNEKRTETVVDAFRKLPRELDASLLLYGDGKLRARIIAETSGLSVKLPGFLSDREQLATALASSDIYVSGMADETFGISIVEAQACGLPVVGVASGAMPERVPARLGLLGPVGDAEVMARNIAQIWLGDRQAIGIAARAHACAHFSWSSTFSTLLDNVYAPALARAAARCRSARSFSRFRRIDALSTS